MMCACDGIILFLMGTLYPVYKGIIEKKESASEHWHLVFCSGIAIKWIASYVHDWNLTGFYFPLSLEKSSVKGKLDSKNLHWITAT